jgi:hypothetical protein
MLRMASVVVSNFTAMLLFQRSIPTVVSQGGLFCPRRPQGFFRILGCCHAF